MFSNSIQNIGDACGGKRSNSIIPQSEVALELNLDLFYVCVCV